ncbi:MAG: hypothetical protein IKY41_07970, partial [Clostridia bacterium]|nr:hypothetical protein [Clostridia bacterium]
KRIIVTSFVCILVVLLAIATGGVFSKYQQSVVANEEVNIKVSSGVLASVFTLQEHKAIQTDDGNYHLDANIPVFENTYYVLPGVDLPKDPHFTILKETDVEAYLYVEIINNLGDNNGLSYEVTTDWKKLDIKGENNGDLYVYTGGEETAKAITKGFDTQDAGLMILQDNKIAVDPVNKSSITEVSISFYGYLAQASRGNDASSVFTNCFLTQ